MYSIFNIWYVLLTSIEVSQRPREQIKNPGVDTIIIIIIIIIIIHYIYKALFLVLKALTSK